MDGDALVEFQTNKPSVMDHITHRHFLLAHGKPPRGVKGTVFSICADEADARRTMLALTQLTVGASEASVKAARERVKNEAAVLGKSADVEEALEQEVAEYKRKAAAIVERRRREYEATLARMEGPGLTPEQQEWFLDMLENSEIDLDFCYDDDDQPHDQHYIDLSRALAIMKREIKSYRRPEQIFDTFKFFSCEIEDEETEFAETFSSHKKQRPA